MTGLKPSGQLRAPSNRTGGEQDKQPVRVAHGRQGQRPARRRLSDAPGLAPRRRWAASRPSVASTSAKNDNRKNPVLGGHGGGPAGTSPSNTLSSKTPAWSSGTPASPRKTARTRRLGAPNRSGQSPSTCRSYSRSRPSPSRWKRRLAPRSRTATTECESLRARYTRLTSLGPRSTCRLAIAAPVTRDARAWGGPGGVRAGMRAG
jgi:hypothetical protein